MKPNQNPFTIKKVFFTTFIALIAMLITVWTTGIAFTAIHFNSAWTDTCYWLSESAGKIGTPIIVMITGLVFTRRLESDRQILKTLTKTVFSLFIIIGAFAFLNEHGTKKILKIPRPSHLYIMERSGGIMTLQDLYSKESSYASLYLTKMMHDHEANFEDIDVKVKKHWSSETGYSFPSGHSFNAFLLACFLTFSMVNSRSHRVRPLFFMPALWAALVAVSRVAMGAHTAADVTFGAVLGMTVGLSFIYWDQIRNLITHRKYNV